MEYFFFPFGDVGKYGKYGSLGDSQGYVAWWRLSQNVDCACPPKAAVRERHHLNHAVVPIRVLRAVWIGGPWLDGYHRSLKLQESFFQQIDQQNSRVFGKERDAAIRWTWWEDLRKIEEEMRWGMNVGGEDSSQRHGTGEGIRGTILLMDLSFSVSLLIVVLPLWITIPVSVFGRTVVAAVRRERSACLLVEAA